MNLAERCTRLEGRLAPGLVTVRLENGGTLRLGRFEMLDGVLASLDYDYGDEHSLPKWWPLALRFIPQPSEPLIGHCKDRAERTIGRKEE